MNLYVLKYLFTKEKPWIVTKKEIVQGDADCKVSFPSGFASAKIGAGSGSTVIQCFPGGGDGGGGKNGAAEKPLP